MKKTSRKRRAETGLAGTTGSKTDFESALCELHNLGATCAGNTQEGDVEWFARWLYGSSNFGAGDVRTMHWSLSNQEFKALGLEPDRSWTGNRWETLDEKSAHAWRKLARLCLYALPHIAERIGHRFMAQAKAIRACNRVASSSNPKLTPRASDGF